MNLFFVLVVVAILGIAFWFQSRSGTAPNADTRTAIELAETTPTPLRASPAPSVQGSPRNYLKRALDRARDVRDEARAGTQQAQEP